MCDPRLRQVPLSELLRNFGGSSQVRNPIVQRQVPLSELFRNFDTSQQVGNPIVQIDDDWVYATPAEVRAEIDRRFPVQPAAPVSGWQPIRTAPINQRIVVLNDGAATVAIYKAGSWWLCAGDMFVGVEGALTHWMPLPEVPK